MSLATDDNALRLQVPFNLFPFLQENQVVFLSLTLTVATIKPMEEPAIVMPKLILPKGH